METLMADQAEGNLKRRAIVIAPFFSTEMNANRPFTAARALSQFAAVDVVTTDFNHWTKKWKEPVQSSNFEKIVHLKTPRYESNVSISRLISHTVFALRASWYFRKHQNEYQVVYVTFPFNTIAWYVFGRARRQLKIADVTDIWPDVLPFPARARRCFKPMFSAWRWFFKTAVSRTDILLSVSDHFLDESIPFAKPTATVKRFYIGHERLRAARAKERIFTIAYVGTIGQLYDFKTLLAVLALAEIRDSMQLHIIGKGDRQDWLLEKLKELGIRHQFFGIVYNTEELGRILRSCHVGFNGYINTTAAFSYKASTYFAAGLPIVNSMQGDLNKLVTRYSLGANYEAGNAQDLRKALMQVYQGDAVGLSERCERFFDAELEADKIFSDFAMFLREQIDNFESIP